MLPDRDAVLALSPDAASSKAAQGLTSPAKWPTLGRSERALWGECKGSGSKPYQVQVDLSGPAFRCSCPSRKFPCKHGLALMLISADQPAALKDGSHPDWVEAWLGGREEKAARKESKEAAKAAAPPPDPAAIARREDQRWGRIDTGCQDLQRWMNDLVAGGIGAEGGPPRQGLATMAARLVDAQAPALGRRLSDANIHASQPDWPQRLLQLFGQLQLITRAVARRAELDATTLTSLRITLGWPEDKAEVLNSADVVEDDWSVLAVFHEQREERLLERRVWLHGERSGRHALLLDHAFGGSGFPQSWPWGIRVAARLAFYPGRSPLRALATPLDAAASTPSNWPARPLAVALDEAAGRFADNPWLPLVPLCLADVLLERQDAGWSLLADGHRLPLELNDNQGWPLLALTGGAPFHAFGEWNGEALRLLAAQAPDGPWYQSGEMIS